VSATGKFRSMQKQPVGMQTVLGRHNNSWLALDSLLTSKRIRGGAVGCETVYDILDALTLQDLSHDYVSVSA
jgi:hypothetical protein